MLNGSSKQISKSLRMVTGIEMENSKTGTKIISECRGLVRRQQLTATEKRKR